MFTNSVAFTQPWYLLAFLLLAPLIWIWSWKSLSGFGRTRYIVANLLRTIVLGLLILALAEMQSVKVSEKVTTIYLLDQSASIPETQRVAMMEYVGAAVSKHRNDRHRDCAGVIAFGREANIEVAPLDGDLFGLLDDLFFDTSRDATNLAGALNLAQASFPEDSAKRVVVITDGNENLGDAVTTAKALVQDGIGVDTIPVHLNVRAEVAVNKVAVPADIRKGEPFQARVVVENITQEGQEAGIVSGKLTLMRRMGGTNVTIDEREVQLDPGKNVYTFTDEIKEPDFYEYISMFTPSDEASDRMNENNRATAFTQVLGEGRVLLIEDFEHPGEFDYLVQRLRRNNIQVRVQQSNQLFSGLAELQAYDSVILANVPRGSGGGDGSGAVYGFDDERIKMLVHNTQELGCGLIMLGGPNSFGAGGWAGTELEKAMPVDFQIKNTRVMPVGALCMIMHASEMAQGNHWQKVIGKAALKALGPQDYCGVVHWDDTTWKEGWLWGAPKGLIPVGQNKKQMMARMGRMTPGDMPDFDPALRMAAAAFSQLQGTAAIKRMIIISDGDPTPPSPGVMAQFVKLKVQISTVAVSTHGPPTTTPLQGIATQTGGKYYVVTNPKALPQIYNIEARQVARPLVKDDKTVQPQRKYPHEIMRGIEGPLPPIKGFVMTTVKKNPLVEVALISPEPADEQYATVLAAWQYKGGRTAVLTTDAGHRWADDWTEWENYDKLFTQLVRWSMRATGDQGQYAVATDYEDGKIKVVIDALDKDDKLLSFLQMAGSVINPEMGTQEMKIKQTAPGRYVGELATSKPGSYFINIRPGADRSTIRVGINVPYSAEYRDRETNIDLLAQLANSRGKLIEGSLEPGKTEDLLAVDTFRRDDLAKNKSSQDVWPLLVLLAGTVFFADVFVRRVTVGFEWMNPAVDFVRTKILRREESKAPDERLARLRSRKAEVSGALDERRAAARFELSPEEEATATTDALDMDKGPTRDSAQRSVGKQTMTPVEEEDSYTSRLLKAKEQAKKDQQRDT